MFLQIPLIRTAFSRILFVFGFFTPKREEELPFIIEDCRSHPDTDVVYPTLHITFCNYTR